MKTSIPILNSLVRSRGLLFPCVGLLGFSLALSQTVCGAELSVVAPRSTLRASLQASPYKTEIYSQNTLENRTRNFVSQTRVSRPVLTIGERVFARVGAWLEQDTLSQGATIYNDNQVSPFVGLAWTSDALSIGATIDAAYVLPWQMQEENGRSSELVGRANLFHSEIWFWDLGSEPSTNWFAETYSSLLLTSRLDDNLIADHWTKGGVRVHGPWATYADLYSELRARANARAYEWDDLGDLRVGARLGFWTRELSMAVSVSGRAVRIWGYDTPPLSGLVVIGGEF